MNEKDLYPIVEKFLKDTIRCFDAQQNKGQGYVGRADVLGIKDIGGLFNSKVIGYAVEVKKTKNPFGKNIGQALGYSLFAHRCYFAAPKKFEDDQIEMANRLGVGLIQINVDNKSCVERLTAQHNEPIENLFLAAVYNLGWYRCDICGEFKKHNERFTENNIPFALKDNRIYHRKITTKDKVYYSNRKVRYSFTICPVCMIDLSNKSKSKK